METIEIKLFSYNELSNEAKDQAFENWQSENSDQQYFWADDALNSLKAGLEHFGVELADYSIDFLNPAYSNFRLDLPYDAGDWTEDELRFIIEDMGEYNPETFKGLGSCKFTGYCADEDFADGVREAYFKDGERDLKELMMEGINSWEEATQRDAEYQYSKERFEEVVAEEDWQFTEDGSRWE